MHDSADGLCEEFERSGQLSTLTQALVLYEDLIAENSKKLVSISDFAYDLYQQFNQKCQPPDLDEIHGLDELVDMLRDTLRLQLEPSVDRSSSLVRFAVGLNMRFRQTGQLADLDEAVELLHEALELLPALHPNRLLPLHILAGLLGNRFRHTGQLVDLDEALELHRETLVLQPTSHPERPVSLTNLASALAIRSRHTGQVADMDEAIELYREALALQPETQPDRWYILSNLASVLAIRFEDTGQLANLDEANELLRNALTLRPAPHCDIWLAYTSLAGVLLRRFGQTHELADLNEAIELDREALKLQPAGHPDRSSPLGSLANALHTRFGQKGQLIDLDETIELLREALRLRPVHADLTFAFVLNDLGNALGSRFLQAYQLADIDEAVELYREGLKLLPAAHADRFALFNNLAITLGRRFSQTEQLPDLEEAIMISRESLHILPQEHPASCDISTNLGTMLVLTGDLDDAMAAFRAAVECETATVSKRLYAAQQWASNADGNHDSALEAFQNAIELLPHLAALELDLPSRQQLLMSNSDGLIRNAAACAIRSGMFVKAVELLEAGRGVFWSQALQLRTPLDELSLARPDLAKRLLHVSHALEQGSFRDFSTGLLNVRRRRRLHEIENVHYRNLNESRVKTLEEIRNLDGFQNFLRPLPFSVLNRAAAQGPVAILVDGISGCTALILTTSDVHHVPLPDITISDANVLIKCIRILTASDVIQSDDMYLQSLQEDIRGDALELLIHKDRFGRRVPDSTSKDPNTVFQSVLKRLWLSVAEPIINALGLKVSHCRLSGTCFFTKLTINLEIRLTSPIVVVPDRRICISPTTCSWFIQHWG